jgi:hypothetical protein
MITATQKAIDEARSIIEDLDSSGAMTIGFDEEEIYEFTGEQMIKIARALYLADLELKNTQNTDPL